MTRSFELSSRNRILRFHHGLLVLAEPDAHMRSRLQPRLDARCSVIGDPIETLGVADNGLVPVTGVMGAELLGFLGAAIGRARGFELRLQAQTALCQVQIELNGRAPVASQYGASDPSPH